MSRIAVTGANGFVGEALVRALVEQGHETSALMRRVSPVPRGASVDA